MKPIEIESWALKTIECAVARLPVEDSKVELKAIWLDPVKAARLLAAHANAAHGEKILWLIGIDEKNGVVVGADYQELSTWIPKVQSYFESISPTLYNNLNVPHNGKTVAALCFDTSRFPYLVKNPAFGSTAGEGVQYEIPWREGNRTRTATRNDLVLMLTPLSRIPRIELLDGSLTLIASPSPHFWLQLNIYVASLDATPLTFPFHKCFGVISAKRKSIAECAGWRMVSTSSQAKHAGPRTTSNVVHSGIVNVHAFADAIEATRDELIVRGCGKVQITADSSRVRPANERKLRLDMTLVEAVTDLKVSFSASFARNLQNKDYVEWKIVL